MDRPLKHNIKSKETYPVLTRYPARYGRPKKLLCTLTGTQPTIESDRTTVTVTLSAELKKMQQFNEL